jgi:DNA repair protein RadA/Sms
MAKDKTLYSCTECGGTSPKWLGKCPSCGAWNTLIESVAEAAAPAAKNRFASLAAAQPVTTLADIDAADFERLPTELDWRKKVQHGNYVWAPSIRYHNGWFYIYRVDLVSWS